MKWIDEVGVGTTTLVLSANDGKGGSIQSDFEVTITKKSSVLGVKLDEHITIYPNPAVDRVTVSSTESVKSIRVFSMEGRLLLNTEKAVQIDISNLVPGNYTVVIQTNDDNQLVYRLIKN